MKNILNFKRDNITHKVYFTDARNIPLYVDNNSVDLAITSPPYFNLKKYSEDENDIGNINSFLEYISFCKIVYRNVFNALRPGRKFFINVMNPPIRTKRGREFMNLFGETVRVCQEIGFIFKGDIVWQKTVSALSQMGSYPYPGSILPNLMHEFIIILEKPCKKSYKKYSLVSEEEKELSKLEKDFWITVKKSDVWKIASVKRSKHPAPFPYEIPYRIIKAFSYVNETVLDPFLGSGTTLEASLNLNRNSIGIELNENYIEIIKEKIMKRTI